jgi:hypothetical protein
MMDEIKSVWSHRIVLVDIMIVTLHAMLQPLARSIRRNSLTATELANGYSRGNLVTLNGN